MPRKTTALHVAVKQHDVALTERLLAAGADPNALDEHAEPPLRYVLLSGVGFMLDDDSERLILALRAAGAKTELRDVGRTLVADARASVCSALEANEARRLAALLGITGP